MLGIIFFLTLLDQKAKFDSLHWRKEINRKFRKEKEAASVLATQSTKPS